MDILVGVLLVLVSALVSSFITLYFNNKRYRKYGTLKIFYTSEEPQPIITAELAHSVDQLAERKEIGMNVEVVYLDSQENPIL